MKKILLSLLAVGAIFTANAQMAEGAQARVYAYDLDYKTESMAVNGSTVTCYDITFKTNTAATSAYVTLKDAAGNEVAKIDAKSGDSKNWTAEVNVTVLPHDIVAGTYSWEVTATAPAVAELTKISDNENSSNFSFFRSYGVAVDNNPESANFGRVYVTNSKSGTTSYEEKDRNTDIGFYTYNPDLTVQNEGKAYACELIGVGTNGTNTTLETTGGNRPNNIAVGNDGNIYAAVREKALSGVYRINPNNFTYTNIFVGTTDENGVITNNDSEFVANIPNAVGVRGEGDNMQIFTINRNRDYVTSTSAYQEFRRYDIGTAATWSAVPSWNATMASKSDYHANNVQIINDVCAIAPVSTGFWATQYRSTCTASNPSIFYVNNDGKVLFSAEGTLGLTSVNTNNGALAVHEELGLVAHVIKSNAKARVFEYSIDENEIVTVDADDVKTYDLTKLGSTANGLAFDYAGNLYAVASTNKECMAVYAIPTDNNTRTTPAKKSLTIEITTDDIATGVEGIAVDANAPVEYYNMQGVKVENPSNGIFIKKQGNKTTKVVL